MGLTSPVTGMGSGLDIKSIVEVSVKDDLHKIQERHDLKQKGINTEISALGQLKSALCNLKDTAAHLSNITQFYKMKTSISEPGYFTAKVNDQAKPGVYQIQVQTLAQSQSLVSNSFANSAASPGSGTLTLNFGTYSSDLSTFTANPDSPSVTITIDPSNSSLSAICDVINSSDAQVTAAIVQDSTGARIVLTSSQTGENNALQITGSLTALNYDPTTNNNALTQTMAAQNSTVQINGLLLNQTTNQLTNVLPGIDLNLTQADTSQTISLTIENNQEQLISCVNDFVKRYNECMNLLNNATGFNKDTKQAGNFQGDAQVKGLKYNLLNIISNLISVPNSNNQLTLADIGLETTKSSTLKLDQDVLKTAINENYSAIGALFAKTITATDPNIQMNSMDTPLAAGAYDVILSQYTPGTSMSGTIGGILAQSPDGIILNGTGKLSSLSINVLGGTDGPRGQILVNDGLASLLDTMLDEYVGKKGIFEHRAESLDKKITDLSKNQKQIDTKALALEKKYYKKWNALDLMIGKMKDTSAMVDQLLNNLPKLKIKD